MADASTLERGDAIRELEPALMTAACAVDAREFGNLVVRVTDALDGDGGAERAEAQHERRRLHVSHLLDGMVAIDGLLDREAGEIVVDALKAAMDPFRTGDLRSTGQRRADALVRVCEASAVGLEKGPGRAHRPVAGLHMDVEVLERRGGPELVRQVRPMPRNSVVFRPRRCGASPATREIARVITDGASAPLDVGRTTRTVPPAMWRALVARDGGCVAEGCDRPPGWCDAHHIQHWVDGGPTDLANLELRCRRHHRAVHEGARGPDPP